MKKHISNQAGIGHVIAVLVFVFVAVIGFAGYTVVSKNAASQPEVATVAPQTDNTIRTKADLQKVDQTLTEADAQLDTQLDDSALDADLDSVL